MFLNLLKLIANFIKFEFIDKYWKLPLTQTFGQRKVVKNWTTLKQDDAYSGDDDVIKGLTHQILFELFLGIRHSGSTSGKSDIDFCCSTFVQTLSDFTLSFTNVKRFLLSSSVSYSSVNGYQVDYNRLCPRLILAKYSRLTSQ